MPVRRGYTGVPLLQNTLAVVECRVAEAVTGGTHRVFLGQVLHAEAVEGSPLAYFRGKFGKLEIAQDVESYQRVRQMVLSRALKPHVTIEVDALSTQLKASPPSVYYALTRLVGENLVTLDPDRGHVVPPVDVKASDDAFDARLAIELGAADLTVGRLTTTQLTDFLRLAEVTGTHVAQGRFTDVKSFITASNAFHVYPLEAVGLTSLVEAYDHLSVPELMTRALTEESDLSPHFIDDHRRLVHAYESADLPAAKHIIVEHIGRGKATQRAGIERAHVKPGPRPRTR